MWVEAPAKGLRFCPNGKGAGPDRHPPWSSPEQCLKVTKQKIKRPHTNTISMTALQEPDSQLLRVAVYDIEMLNVKVGGNDSWMMILGQMCVSQYFTPSRRQLHSTRVCFWSQFHGHVVPL